MKNKVTHNTLEYPENHRPNLVIPCTNKSYRYFIGKDSSNPLVAICMNPSAASDDKSDRTINRVINISEKLNYDGWVVFNIYPERATDASFLEKYDGDFASKNLKYIKDYLIKKEIKEIWGAWGDLKYESLRKGKDNMLNLLSNLNINIFYFGTLTNSGNPRHPLQRQESWEKINYYKKYLEL